ncbi:subtilase-type protease inhibitor [Streptomyces microflavus]|uniref:subtilase-type protease inhibitor n=1 Tax=Streptomyces microflavus TaxID=1919 RepID=UPI002E34C084|nr:subtilase-type protease inhibitor [Streptomyces microflavus]
MRHNRHAIFATIAASTLVLGGLAATSAHAAPAKAESLYAPSALVLTVAQGEDPLTATVQRAVTLTCAPSAEGTHPAPEAACKELDSVGGQFTQLARTSPDRMCTRQWNPVVITAHGVWHGKRVTFSTTYGNACELAGSMNDSAVYSF